MLLSRFFRNFVFQILLDAQSVRVFVSVSHGFHIKIRIAVFKIDVFVAALGIYIPFLRVGMPEESRLEVGTFACFLFELHLFLGSVIFDMFPQATGIRVFLGATGYLATVRFLRIQNFVIF